MKIKWFLPGLVLLFSCTVTQKDIELLVQEDRIILKNWIPGNTLEADQEFVTLYVWDDDKKQSGQYPVDGSLVQLEDGTVAYVPRFPLDANTRYILKLNDKFQKIERIVQLPKKTRERTFVSAVYPTSDTLPENLLRMYVQFSQPMKTVGTLDRIKLMDDRGNEVKDAIFSNVYELWDAQQQQLTLIFDPARVKTGLKANEAFGRALQPGRRYQLVIDSLEDIYDQKLTRAFRKTLYIVDEDSTAPDTGRWMLFPPRAGSRTPLTIQFPEMLDRYSLLRRFSIKTPDGKPLPGTITVENNETLWKFTPNTHWHPGSHTLLINSRLEDPSGNNLNGLFDHAIGSLLNKEEGKIVEMVFQVDD